MKRTSYSRFLARAAVTLLAVFSFSGAWADEVEIGDGTLTTKYVPIGTYYNYSITEQLYTSDEIGTAGTITSISFHYTGAAAKDFPIAVYMANVDAEDLESEGISLADADEVFNGTLSVPAEDGWVTIELDTPFAYDGTSNLLIGINKGYVYYFSGDTWYCTATESQMTRYNQNDANAYDITASVPGQAINNRPNIKIDITPSAGPVYKKPTDLIVSDLTSTGATISWTAPEGSPTGYAYQYKKASDADWSAETSVNTTSVALSNLEPAKAYNFRVKAVYGTDGESIFVSIKFTTDCDVITTFPWTENFESYASGNFNAPCWVNEHIDGNGSNIFKISTSSLGGNSTHQLQLPDMSEGTLTKLVLPAMDLNGNYQLVLDVYRSNSSYNNSYASEGIRVFVSADGQIEDATEIGFIPRQYDVSSTIVPAEAAFGWYTYEVPIPMTGFCHLILRGESQYCTSTYMDNFVVELVPTCRKPTGVNASDVTNHTATIGWTSDADAWQIMVNDDEENLIDVTETTYTFNGLTPETDYTVKVRTNCGGVYSDWTNAISFTTTIACPAPTGLAFTLTPGDGTVATFSWTENGSATAWQLCINGDEDNLIDMDENPFTYNGFTPEETYTAKVRAVCGGIDGESAWSNTVTFTPTDAYMLTVNDGTTTNSYVPVYGMWIDSYTKCQFIIPASDLEAMQYGNISKMTFYTSTQDKTWGAAEFDILLAEVDNTTFENATLVDWSSMQQVYHGAVSVRDYKMEIVFDDGYQYMGGNLLVGFHQTVKGTYSSITWFGITSQNSAIGGYESDAKAIGLQNFLPKTTFAYEPGEAPTCDRPEGLAVVGDPEAHSVVLEWTETGGASAWQLCLNGDEDNLIDVDENPYTLTGIDADTDFTVKVRASCSDTDHSPWSSGISFHTPETCPKPTNLIVTYNGGNTAEVSWDSESTDFNIDVNGTVTAITENPYTLTNLELATTYTVKVQANCGGGEVSAWVTADPFTTDQCMPEDMCELTFVVTDSYGDGWNGNAIVVTDVESGNVLATIANQNLDGQSGQSGYEETQTITLAVCDGRELKFSWTTGSFTDEVSYTVTDINDEVIVEGSGAGFDTFNYTVNCSSCFKPKNLTATNVSTTSATLSWTGYNDSYVLQYRPWHQVGEDQIATEEFVTYTYDLSEFSGTGSIAIRHYDVSDVFYLNVDNIELTDADGDVIVSEDFESGAIPSTWTNYDVDGDGYTWELAETGSMNVIDDYGIYSASWISNVGALNPDNWLIIPNVELGGTLSFAARGQDPNYPSENFAVYVSTESSLTEVELEDPTYTADNLEPSTPYTWQVKGLCGTDEESRWSSSMFKTTDDVLVFATDGDWNEVSNWTDAEGNAITELPTIENKVRIDADATIPADVIAYAGKTTISDGGSITIADGGQLKHKAATLKVTLNKNITGYGEGTGNYKLISSPFTGTTQIGYNGSGWSYVDITGDGYDLYGFASTEDNEWINNESSSQHAVFTSGSNYGLRYLDGYLYANEEDITLDFTGTAPSSVISTHSVDVTYDDNSTDMFNGWKLVGNPFTCNATISFVDDSDAPLDATFYTMNATGDGFDAYENFVVLAPGEGAFIHYNESGTIKYSSEVSGTPNDGTPEDLPFLPLHGLTNNQDANVITTTIRFAPEGFATYYNGLYDVELPDNDMKAYIVTGATDATDAESDKILTYQPIAGGSTGTNIVPATTAVLLQIAPEDDVIQRSIFLKRPTASVSWDANYLHGSDNAGQTIGDGLFYMLSYDTNGENIGWYYGADGGAAFENGAHKAYLALPSSSGTRSFLGLPDYEGTMGIISVGNEKSNDGNNTWYTVDGVRLDKRPSKKGLYIQNGVKVVIK